MIIQKLDALNIRKERVCRDPLTTTKRLAITLAKLASSGELRNIAHTFGVARSTVCVVVNTTCKQITATFSGEIKFPRGDDLDEVSNSFLGLGGLPGVCGAVDGSHIPIKAPHINSRDYYCRKNFYSVVLQAVVDHKKMFTNINFGWPGSVHDSRVLSNSELFGLCERRELLDRNCQLPGTNQWINMYIVGDPAYPLKTWLMKPVIGTLTAAEQKFNKMLSKNRVHVEHAFGMLKGRWRSLLKENDATLRNLQFQVVACCILHNFCQRVQDEFLYEWEEGTKMTSSDDLVSTASTNNSRQIRQILIDWANSV